ncbi:MAG: sporulation protein YtxC [Cellulosilyticaceae bacterium]
MVQYMIATTKYTDIFREYLKDTHQYPFDLSKHWKERCEGKVHTFEFEGTKKDKSLMLERIATIISNIVQSSVLTKFAKESLKTRIDLTAKEKKEVESLFVINNYVAKEEGVSYISYYLLYTPILKVLEEQKVLNIDGWILFRTHQYKIILEDILEQTIYDYQTQKDYLRFINLLRESRKVQESLESTLHLIQEVNKKMKILNTNKKDITEEYIALYCTELMGETEVTEEDLIMNVFITVCPKKVVIHNRKEYPNQQFIETLEMIFEGEIEYCEGCDMCLDKENTTSD